MVSIMEELVPEPEVWTARLRDFVHECIESAPGEEADRIREAMVLLHRGAMMSTRIHSADPSVVETMLACGAPESAVLAMFAPEAVFMVSRGQDNACLATVIAGAEADEVISEGATLALALLAAYVAGLLAGLERSHDIPCISFARQTTRLH